MKRLLMALSATAVLILGVSPSEGQDKKPPEQEKSGIWMKKKLEFTQSILAGLTESDFDKVRRNAQAMSLMGYLEKWARAGEPDYKQQLTYFEHANKELIRQSKEKNLDGSLLAYYQLTTSCVRCHSIVRDVKK